MREIKFRGLTEYDRWVFGTPVYYDSGEVCIFPKFPKYGTEATNIVLRTKVIPETISQYAGLKDKNGKDIYEGDLLSHKFYARPVVVTFESGCFQAEDVSMHSDCIEVIGNIHQNPELL